MEKPIKISNFINNVFVPTENYFESFNPRYLYINFQQKF